MSTVRQRPRPRILLCTPEITELPEGVGNAANFVRAKGGGLGDIIVNQAAYGLEGVVGAAICVSVLALAADAALGLVQRLLTPPGLRAEARAFEPDVLTGTSHR